MTRGLRGALAGALIVGVGACGKQAPPPAAEKKPAPVTVAPVEAPRTEPPQQPTAKATLGPGDLAIGTPIESLGTSQFFARLVMTDEPGGARFGGRTVNAFLDETRVDPAKGIHFCIQNTDASAFGGRMAKGEYQLFTPNLLQRDPLAIPANAVSCVQGGETLWNEFRKVENAGLPRGQGEAYGQPARVEIQVRARKVDLVDLRFTLPTPDAFTAIRNGFAGDVGALVEPPAGASEACALYTPVNGAAAYLLRKGAEVRIVFGAAAPAACAPGNATAPPPAK